MRKVWLLYAKRVSEVAGVVSRRCHKQSHTSHLNLITQSLQRKRGNDLSPRCVSQVSNYTHELMGLALFLFYYIIWIMIRVLSHLKCSPGCQLFESGCFNDFVFMTYVDISANVFDWLWEWQMSGGIPQQSQLHSQTGYCSMYMFHLLCRFGSYWVYPQNLIIKLISFHPCHCLWELQKLIILKT